MGRDPTRTGGGNGKRAGYPFQDVEISTLIIEGSSPSLFTEHYRYLKQPYMTRRIKATAKNGEQNVTLNVTLDLNGLMRDEVTAKVEKFKDDLYQFLSVKYHYSQVKID